MLEVPKLNEPFHYWRELPRSFGTPFQRMVFTDEQLTQYLKVFNGTDICFISHNSYPDFDKNGTPETVNVTKCFIDIDNKDKPENALLDARNLLRWSISHDIPCSIAFSGQKGFHYYLLLKPEKYKLNSSLSNALYSIQKFLCDKAKTRFHDVKVWGDPKRLCRVWYTQYVTITEGQQMRTDTFCCPLSPEMVLTMGINEIIEYSKNPKHIEFPQDFAGYYLTLREFIKTFKVPYEKIAVGDERGYVKETMLKDYKKPDDEYIIELIPRMCVHSQLISDNPVHDARFCAVVRLKSLGWSFEQIFNFLMSMNWIDSHNIGAMRYQIKHIFKKRNPPYYHPSCGTIKKKGFCVGKKCPRYWES